jgi:hypothetical protein
MAGRPTIGYKIRHKPTGLFYCKSRGVKNQAGHYVKTNLSPKGRVYSMSPSLSWAGTRIYTHLHKENRSKVINVALSDWEIVAPNQIPPPPPPSVTIEDWIFQLGIEAIKKVTIKRDGKIYSKEDEEVLREMFKAGLAAVENAKKEFRMKGAL